MRKKKNEALWLLLLLFFAIFGFSLYKIVSINSVYQENEKVYEELGTQVITEMPQTTELPKTSESEEVVSESAPTISVDFDKLGQQNSDVVGWIYCKDTPISYPVLQAEDNDYYLQRMINGKYNAGGSIFMDYRSDSKFASLNTIIYGHNMKNGSMFGMLERYKNQTYYEEHPVLWYLTPEGNYKIEPILGYVTGAVSEAYTDFQTEEELDKYLEEAMSYSTFVSHVALETVEQIVTLSTCSYEYDDARYVLVGKIEKIME